MFSSNSYRYGMNGQEKDDEIANGVYSAEYWEYDSRLGRRWNVDPVTYAWISPYATFQNDPVLIADPNGADGTPTTGGTDPEFPLNKGGEAITLPEIEITASSQPLTNSGFELMMSEQGINRGTTDNLTFNKMKGFAFENAYLNYRDKLRNSQLFPSGTPGYSVRPDALGNGSRYRQEPGFFVGKSWYEIYPNSVVYEVKGISSDVGLTKQIKGEINAASNSKSSEGNYATQCGQAQIVIVTFADVSIKSTVVQYATSQGVHLYHVTANYNPLTGDIGFSIPTLLNPMGKEIPIPLKYNSDGVQINWNSVKSFYNATNESGNND